MQATMPSTQRRASFDALSLSIEWLGRTLTADIPGHEREWAEEVGYALANIHKGLRQHLAVVYAPDGALAEIEKLRPTLSRQVIELRRQQERLLGQCAALREEVERAAAAFTPGMETFDRSAAEPAENGGVADFSGIRDQAGQLVSNLQEAKATEASLLLESVNTDIGGGD